MVLFAFPEHTLCNTLFSAPWFEFTSGLGDTFCMLLMFETINILFNSLLNISLILPYGVPVPQRYRSWVIMIQLAFAVWIPSAMTQCKIQFRVVLHNTLSISGKQLECRRTTHTYQGMIILSFKTNFARIRLTLSEQWRKIRRVAFFFDTPCINKV